MFPHLIEIPFQSAITHEIKFHQAPTNQLIIIIIIGFLFDILDSRVKIDLYDNKLISNRVPNKKTSILKSNFILPQISLFIFQNKE